MGKRKATPQKYGPVPQKKQKSTSANPKPHSRAQPTSNTASGPTHSTISPPVATARLNGTNTSASTTSQPTTTTQPNITRPDLLSIPPELRYIIYDYSVEPGHVVSLAPGHAAGKSTNPIFLLNRNVRKEAEDNLVRKGLVSINYYANIRVTVQDLDFRKLMAMLKKLGPANFVLNGPKKLFVDLTMSDLTKQAHGVDLDAEKLGKMLAFLDKHGVEWKCKMVNQGANVWVNVIGQMDELLHVTARDTSMRHRVKYLLDVLQDGRRARQTQSSSQAWPFKRVVNTNAK